MPNWCWSKIHVSGDPEDMKALVERVRGPSYEHPPDSFNPERDAVNEPQEFCFHQVIPMPAVLTGVHDGSATSDGVQFKRWLEERDPTTGKWVRRGLTEEQLKMLREEAGAESWYDWAYANWGTKWECSVTAAEIDIEKGEAYYEIKTAWASPEPVIEALRALHPSLEISVEWSEEGGEAGAY